MATTGEDSDGVWSQDIEDAFEEALALYPPCGRRKIILSEEGKMYGRNELIARYIKMRTGKTRSRKQVSSHIQVLARKKQREIQSKLKTNPEAAEHLKAQLSRLSSAEIVSSQFQPSPGSSPFGAAQAAGNQHRMAYSFSGMMSPGKKFDHGNHGQGSHSLTSQQPLFPEHFAGASPSTFGSTPTYNGIAKLRLAMDHMSACIDYPRFNGKHTFLELLGSHHYADPCMECLDVRLFADLFPGLAQMFDVGPMEAFFMVKFWVSMTFDTERTKELTHENPTQGFASPAAFMHISCSFESLESLPVEFSVAVFSLGKVVLEKSFPVHPIHDPSGRFLYKVDKLPICPYLTNFIQKLRSLDNASDMNRVLEHFGAVMSIRVQGTNEVLFCSACMFEVAEPGASTGHHVYKLLNMGQDDPTRRFTR